MRNGMGSLDLLVVEELSVGHGSAPVCAPVDLRLGPGRALAVVGPNGSGKSTLLRTLVGLLEPLAGTVAFDGAPVDERAAAFRRDVAAVLDDDAFFISLTGREHLLLTARGHGVAAAEEAVDDEVEAFGLGDRADALPSALSSGQRRRLALAAAFVRPARLLVLDEPERRLDAGMRARLAARLGSLRDAGTAVLLASHDADVVATVADEVLVVDDDACRLLDPVEAAGRIAEL
ncbi:ABC transporter ATP-binding protein [Geodermatophilus poikilotrophus]|uniref:ABC transporter n=1 Tax=Geodermatophilus poikilotrophus TaxID=1333667 RepID=A0A1H9ZGA5_9ACTN|nr:ABC transporter ATP-binding protein [Geodermatophilus poikilotrophus]SES80630.1 ABC transporter [Geodermatophilus poikilotrophus]